MKPRTDVRAFISNANYVLQLSNDMETYCYTINEALSYGVPIVTTPLSILKELPITNNEHIVLDYDCTNVDDVAKQIFEKEVRSFTYEPPKDNWNKLLAKGKSTYKYEPFKKIKTKVRNIYWDATLNRTRIPGEQIEINNEEIYENMLKQKLIYEVE